MKRTAKSLIATLLTLVMLMSSFVILGVSGSAATEISGTDWGDNVGVETTADSVLASSSTGNFNVCWRNVIDTVNYPDVQKLSLLFTVEKVGDTYSGFEMRIKVSSNDFTVFLNFDDQGQILDGKKEKVLGDYTDGSADVRMDLTADWASATGTRNGTLSVDYYIDGKYVYTATMGQLGRPQPNSDYPNNLNFRSSGTRNGQIKLTNMKAYNGHPSIYICEGAYMRLNDDLATSGLRFEFGVDKAWFDRPQLEGATVGAFIVPTDLMEGKSMTSLTDLAAAGAIEFSDIGFINAETATDTYTYNASIVKILEDNYARSFSAIGYVKVGEEIVAWTDTQSRSVYQVATLAMASGEESEKNQQLLKGYLDKVVTITDTDGDYKISAIENYTNPYTVTGDTNGFTVTGEGAENVTAIFLNGVLYTKKASGEKWTTGEGYLTITRSSES